MADSSHSTTDKAPDCQSQHVQRLTCKKSRNRLRSKRQRLTRRAKKQELESIQQQLAHKKDELLLVKSSYQKVQKKLLSRTTAVHVSSQPNQLTSTAKVSSSRPTAGSKTRERELVTLDGPIVRVLDRYSLKKAPGKGELCSGAFGTCKKMLMSSTEVAVKVFNEELSSRDAILYEAKVMARVCNGHPNLPLFLGVYDEPGNHQPQLVTKYYSVESMPATLYMLLTGKLKLTLSECQWGMIMLNICNALEAIHSHGFLHNDIKSDNIILSDTVPAYENSPPLIPIVVDFGKSRPLTKPKKYRLSEDEKRHYRIHHNHIAPEVINGTHSQSTYSDVYSVGRIVCKSAKLISSSSLQSIGTKCMSVNPERRPSLIRLYSYLSDITLR